MRYLSLFSGIEAATVAWHPLGWTPLAFAEIEKFPSAVLAHHYPDVPNLGDITQVDWSAHAGADVLVGGSPCQSFSVAGLRRGLDDPRGNLALEYLRAVDAVRPRWVVWENVPGVLSSGGGRDFGTFLGALGQLGYGWAYRVLDAQYVRVQSHPRAVPQRRRRVFVVGCLGDWRGATAVLLERESLRGHPAPRREAGAGVAALTATGVGTCGADDNQAQAGHLVAQPYRVHGENSTAMRGNGVARVAAACECARSLDTCGGYAANQGGNLVAHTLRAEGFDASEDGTGRGVPIVMAPAFSKRPGQQIATREDGSSFALTSGEPPRVLCYNPLQGDTSRQGMDDASTQEADAREVLRDVWQEDGAQAASERRPGVSDPLQPTEVLQHDVLCEPTDSADGRPVLGDGALPLAEGVSAGSVSVVRERRQDGRASQGRGLAEQQPRQPCAAMPKLPPQGSQVRRLTPLEAERLQGFPDDYTRIPYRGKPAGKCPDGPRYKALGNSMAVNCMSWIGERIEVVA